MTTPKWIHNPAERAELRRLLLRDIANGGCPGIETKRFSSCLDILEAFEDLTYFLSRIATTRQKIDALDRQIAAGVGIALPEPELPASL